MTRVPGNLQVELAMLWRTLSLIEGVDGLSIVDFYEKYTPTVKSMPPLSLSAYWENVACGRSSIGNVRSLVGIPRSEVPVSGLEESETMENKLMNLPELDYLRHGDRIDLKHDPLSVVQNLYGAAASIESAANPRNQSILFSACSSLAVKSGRASLMLHFISLITTQMHRDMNEHVISLDIDSLKDIWDFIESGKKRTIIPPESVPHSLHLEVPLNPLAFNATSKAIEVNSGLGSLDSDPMCECKKGMVLSCGKADHGKVA